VTVRFTFLSGARAGQVETFHKPYIELGRHPLSDVHFDADRDLDVSARHAAILRQADSFIVRDMGSKNGTFINGRRITGDAAVQDGDVIGFGPTGPAVEFRIVLAATGESARREQDETMPAVVAPRRSSTALRIAAEVARQTRGLRRATKLLVGLLALALVALGWDQWQRARDARAVAGLQSRADSLTRGTHQLLSRFQSELANLRRALEQSQGEVARLSSELAAARSSGAAGSVARLRSLLDAAEARQRRLAGAATVDYRSIAQRNQDAVALLVIKFSDAEIVGGTAFAVDSGGTLVTNKHVLLGEQGNRRPEAIAVKFSGSEQWFPAQFVGAADTADVGVLKVAIRGGTPRVLGFARDLHGLERGDPVAIIGYPLGEDLPMEQRGRTAVADPTLTVGTVSKVLPHVVQVDGYGAPGSSGSPIFDREGRVVAVLYGGNRESQGKIIYGVPAAHVVAYLDRLR
jgi:S1-C subfamily serine protease